MVLANPIAVICSIAPTITDSITEMEIAHNMGNSLYLHQILTQKKDINFNENFILA